VDLAFAADSSLRHVWAGPRESTGEMPRRLTGYEIPGELYVYRGFEPWHSTPQERLSLAEPAVDDMPVVRLAWSPDGRSIAYGRGETGNEGTWLSSLWVVQLGAARDESATGIAQRTELLDNLRGSPVHVSEFTWAPDGAGLLALVHDATRPGEPAQKRLRYLRRDGQGSFDSPALTGFVSDLASLALSFSPDGRHYDYVAGDPLHDDGRSALYVQSADGGEPVRASIELPDGATLVGPLPWSPHGDAVVYGIVGGGEWSYHLARTDGLSQPLAVFFDAGQAIREVRVK
jgi:Tol biopolymer transport system component